MTQRETRIPIRKIHVLLAAVFIICIGLLAAKPAPSYAKNAKPFITLKVGSKNLTSIMNKSYMPYSGQFDGGIEIYMADYKGVIKKGSRFTIKLKKGYKAILYYVTADGKRKKIKNNFRIPTSDKSWCIDIQIKKGKTTSYYWLLPYSEYEDDDYDDE